MKRASLVFSLAVVVGCASILDIPQLQAPPSEGDGGVDSGSAADAVAEGACPGKEVSNLTRAKRGVHTALDATDVYFTRADPPRDSAILRCSKCGCDKPTELATLNLPGGIAVDERYVFWTDSQESGSLNRMDKRDPTKRQQVVAQEVPFGVAVDAQYVYWTVIGGGPKGVSTAGVYRAKKDDLSEVTRLAKSEELPDNIGPYAIAVDDMNVYYTTAPDIDSSNPEQPCNGKFGTVRRVSRTGGLQVSTVIASGQACPVGLALGKDTVYWANLGTTALSGSVWMTSKAAGTATLVADKLGRPTSLAFHAGRLAWNVPASERVESCTVPACSDVATLANDQRNPSGLSADDSGIYWVVLGTVGENFADGALRRIALP